MYRRSFCFIIWACSAPPTAVTQAKNGLRRFAPGRQELPLIYATEPMEWVDGRNTRNPWDGGPTWVKLPPIYAFDLLCFGLQLVADLAGPDVWFLA